MPLLEVLTFQEQGYMPLVFDGDWQVAVLNWEPLFERSNLGEIERHESTDEVFVLWRGKAGLFVSDGQRLSLQEMELGTIYNVPKGTWHNLIASTDASWIIVESRDTHLHDTEIRQMTADEQDQLLSQLPAWLE